MVLRRFSDKILEKTQLQTLTFVEGQILKITEESLSVNDKETLIKSITEHNKCMENFSPERLEEIIERVQDATIPKLLSILKIEQKVTLLLRDSIEQCNKGLWGIFICAVLSPGFVLLSTLKVLPFTSSGLLPVLMSIALNVIMVFSGCGAVVNRTMIPFLKSHTCKTLAKKAFQTYTNPKTKNTPHLS